MQAPLAVFALILGTYLYNPELFRPFFDLLQTMVLDKASSSSGKERTYWNLRSLQSFLDTYGLGVGLGSSRSSSWPVSVLSQLGVVGSFMVALLIGFLIRGMGRLRASEAEKPVFALCASARATAVAYLLAGTIAGGAADPGVLFFAALATVLACRRHVRAQRRRHEMQHYSPSVYAAPQPFGEGSAALHPM